MSLAAEPELAGPRPGLAGARRELAAAEQLSRSFKAAIAAVRRLRGRDTQRPGELSYAQYGLLFGLAERGQLSSGELALAADLSPATVAQMLDSLAIAGLVRRVRSERDKRVVMTSLTERGIALVGQRRAALEPKWRLALSEFDDEQLLTAAAVLERLRALFDEIADGGPEATLDPRGDQVGD